MNHHYLILFIQPLRWGVLHGTSEITEEEVNEFMRRGAKDIVNITNPEQPESLVFFMPDKPENN